MQLEIEDNANTRGSDQFVFVEIGIPRELRAIRVEDRGVEVLYEVASVGADGRFGTAHAVKITDSGEGFAYLIYGFEWGIRLRLEATAEPWDFTNPRQWGEPFKIYGNEEDLVYV